MDTGKRLHCESKTFRYQEKIVKLWNLFMSLLFYKQNVLRFLLAFHKFEVVCSVLFLNKMDRFGHIHAI